jgi:hypothetical protein
MFSLTGLLGVGMKNNFFDQVFVDKLTNFDQSADEFHNDVLRNFQVFLNGHIQRQF